MCVSVCVFVCVCVCVSVCLSVSEHIQNHTRDLYQFVANVNVRYMLSPVRPSVVCLSVVWCKGLGGEGVRIFAYPIDFTIGF